MPAWEANKEPRVARQEKGGRAKTRRARLETKKPAQWRAGGVEKPPKRVMRGSSVLCVTERRLLQVGWRNGILENAPNHQHKQYEADEIHQPDGVLGVWILREDSPRGDAGGEHEC